MKQVLFLIVFLGALSTPGILTLKKIAAGEEQQQNGIERRQLSTVRGLFEKTKPSDYMTTMPLLGDALKDQLTWRTGVTKAVNTNLILLGHTTNPSIAIGKQGFWFQTTAPKFNRLPCAAHKGVNYPAAVDMLEKYRDFESRALKKGIKTVAIIVPTTPYIYPEALPDVFKTRCQQIDYKLTQLVNSGNYGSVFYDIEWFKSQEMGAVYDPRSFHWNRVGAQRYIKLLLDNKINHDLPEVVVSGESERSFDIDNASDLGVAPLKQTYRLQSFKDKPELSTNWKELTGDDAFHGIVRKGRSDTILVTKYPDKKSTGVLFGDSFTAMPWSYFNRHFGKAYRFHTSFLNLKAGMLDTIADELEPDYFFVLLTVHKWQIPIKRDKRRRGFQVIFDEK